MQSILLLFENNSYFILFIIKYNVYLQSEIVHMNFKSATMKILNKQSTATLIKLLEMAEASDGHVKIDNTKGFFMPVCVEVIEKCESLVKVSVAHYYEQNGDLMADPEMCFAVRNDKLGCMVIPYYFKQDGLGIERESVIFEGEKFKGYYQRIQADQAIFANMWIKNIKLQQKI